MFWTLMMSLGNVCEYLTRKKSKKMSTFSNIKVLELIIFYTWRLKSEKIERQNHLHFAKNKRNLESKITRPTKGKVNIQRVMLKNHLKVKNLRHKDD